MDRYDGFAEYVAGHRAGLSRAGYLLTCDAHLAEVAVREALVTAASRWRRIRAGGDPDPAVRRILYASQTDAWRHWGRPPIVPSDQRDDEGNADVDEPADSPDVAERRRALRRALLGLSPRQRAVVVARYLEGLTEGETADLFDWSPGAVRSQARQSSVGSDLAPALRDLAEQGPVVGDADEAMVSADRRRRKHRATTVVAVAALAVVATAISARAPADRHAGPGQAVTTGTLLEPVAPLPQPRSDVGPLRTLAHCGRDCRTDAVAWSPDRSRVAWVASGQHGGSSPRWGLWVAAAGSAPRRLVTCSRPSCLISSVGWSADGSTLAYSYTSAASLPGLRHTFELVTIKSDGTRRLVSTEETSTSEVRWSPAGDHLAWWTVSGYLLVGGDGSGASNFVPSAGLTDLTWAPDGGQLAAVAVDRVQISNASGTRTQIVATPGATAPPSTVRWSPTSSQIGFVTPIASFPRTAFAVWAASLSDTVAIRLLSATAQTRRLVWAPDGSALQVGVAVDHGDREGSSGGQVLAVPASGGVVRPISLAAYRRSLADSRTRRTPTS